MDLNKKFMGFIQSIKIDATYSTVLRKPNRYIDDAAARIFPPS